MKFYKVMKKCQNGKKFKHFKKLWKSMANQEQYISVVVSLFKTFLSTFLLVQYQVENRRKVEFWIFFSIFAIFQTLQISTGIIWSHKYKSQQ